MGVVLDHTIVPASDKVASATFLARLLGLAGPVSSGPFSAVPVNDELTLDFDDRHGVRAGHYAFLVDDDTFDALLTRLDGVDFGAGPEHGWNRRVGRLPDGRVVYVRDPDGHGYEFFTRQEPRATGAGGHRPG